MIDTETDTSDAVEGTQSSEDLFELNIRAFANINKGIYDRLRSHKPISSLVFDSEGRPNVTYDDITFYSDDAKTTAERQLKTFEAHSRRLTMASIGSGEGLDLHTRQVHERFSSKFDQSGFRFTHQPYRPNSYFAVVFGIGLGLHLEGIAEKTNCRHLILFEPNFDLVYHSLSVCDWVSIIERFQSKGTIELFLTSDARALSQNLKSVFRLFNPASLDGTVVFNHYNSSIFQEVDKHMSDELRTAVMGLGFFQDEINMIGQTYKNLEDGKARTIKGVEKSPGLPAFVVASGPSLEKLLPLLRENQDKAVIFACGTAIDILMANDIKPDFWVMMERIKAIYVDIKETSEIYDFSDIRFIGSTTIFPRVPALFKESIFFFRPGLSSSPLFSNRQDQIVPVPDPLAANAGLSAALHLGFREIFFLGVDVGSPFKDRGHAAGTVYERRDGEPITDLGLPVPGNFGGTAWTTPILQWSKENLEKLITFKPGRVYYNLGTGALIKGATPLHPKAVKLADSPPNKLSIVEQVIDSCPIYTQADFDEAWEQSAVIDRLPEVCSELRKLLDEETDFEDFEYISKTMKLLRPPAVDDPIAMLLRGTLFTAITAFEYYANRAVDVEERETMFDIFKQEYSVLLDDLQARAIEIFTSLENGHPWDEEFIE
ncbi:MAG: hypothetical protein CBB68_09555 [Rhodospirillaceae bacterium TMED8]|nr:hypothetical protein [Magnetovibrio sp.]OUT50106.1 MAG: hypothetical protein CBB68_09555 [Rhodospirillaceae bacterium TMED8]|tara:strand:- start:420 stop:2393 length:1974 start_codon:yes stop_codon:yes gene_type:complete